LPDAQKSHIGRDLGLKSGESWRRFGVLTLHRASNVDSLEKLADLLVAVRAVAAEVPIIFPSTHALKSGSRKPESRTTHN
jgi:UDP-N-acetylglucosamine 2-epimerase